MAKVTWEFEQSRLSNEREFFVSCFHINRELYLVVDKATGQIISEQTAFTVQRAAGVHRGTTKPRKPDVHLCAAFAMARAMGLRVGQPIVVNVEFNVGRLHGKSEM